MNALRIHRNQVTSACTRSLRTGIYCEVLKKTDVCLAETIRK